MRNREPYSLLYDRDCRICSTFARLARLIDVRRVLSVRSIQESGDLLVAIPVEQRLAAAHVVSPDGRVTSGGEAMPAILAALVAGPGFEDRIRSSRASMVALDGLYAVMAEMRGRLNCAAAGPVSAGRSLR